MYFAIECSYRKLFSEINETEKFLCFSSLSDIDMKAFLVQPDRRKVGGQSLFHLPLYECILIPVYLIYCKLHGHVLCNFSYGSKTVDPFHTLFNNPNYRICTNDLYALYLSYLRFSKKDTFD